jgi:hypothetical protein
MVLIAIQKINIITLRSTSAHLYDETKLSKAKGMVCQDDCPKSLRL